MTQGTLNVCMYTPTAHGGHAHYARELLSALAESGPARGVDVELITCEDLAEDLRLPYPAHRILPRQVPREAFRSTPSWASSRIAYYAERERVFSGWLASRPDVGLVHFQEYTPWLAPGQFRRLRRLGIRVVFTVHNIKNHYKKFFMHSLIRDNCFRSAWRSCDALLVHTEGLRASLSSFLSGVHPPIHVTPHAVWRGEGRPEPPRLEPGGRVRLLFFGVLRPNKGVHVLLRALRRLPWCDLTVAGEADEPHYLDEIRGLIGEFPQGRVELIDRYIDEDEVLGLFGTCHLAILPYTSFTSQSGVLHQALAHGRPVVASDVGGLGECVRRWGIGRVVPPADDQALAEAIARSVEPIAYHQAVEAIRRVSGQLTWTNMAELTLDVYRSIVPAGRSDLPISSAASIIAKRGESIPCRSFPEETAAIERAWASFEDATPWSGRGS